MGILASKSRTASSVSNFFFRAGLAGIFYMAVASILFFEGFSPRLSRGCAGNFFSPFFFI